LNLNPKDFVLMSGGVGRNEIDWLFPLTKFPYKRVCPVFANQQILILNL